MSRKTHQKAIARLDALYARLPSVACKGLCFAACGPIPMTTVEAERLHRADGRRRLPMIRADASCVYLNEKQRCSVYAVRPLICRTWGVVKRMSCMHGCEPDRWLSDHEFVAIAKEIERVGGPLVVSSIDGVAATDATFLDLDMSRLSEPQAEALAERTRSLRALHGGRIMAVHPSADPRWIDLDEVKGR